MKQYTILVGSDLPENLSEELHFRAKEVANRITDGEVQVLKLVEPECKKIIQVRAQLQNNIDILEGINNKEKQEQVQKDVITFINRIKTNEAPLSLLKERTTMSWNQFNKVLDEWELFGFVTFKDKRKTVCFHVEEKAIKENVLNDIQSDCDLLIQKLRTVKHKFNSKEIKQIESFERKLKLTINVTS